MITDNQLKSLLNDKSLDKVSREQIEEIIDSEMKKDESEIDAELIEYCLDILDDSDNKIRSDFSKKKASRNGNVKYIKPRFKKIIAVAAVIAIVFVAAISGTASVSHHVMYDGVVELDGNSLFIDLSKVGVKSESSDNSDDKLIKELFENGFTDVLLPEALLSDGLTITDAIYSYNEIGGGSASIKFTYDGKPGCISVSLFDTDLLIGKSEYLNISSAVEQVKTDKTTAFCFTQNKNDIAAIVYRSGLCEYYIQLSVSLDEAIQIAETLN